MRVFPYIASIIYSQNVHKEIYLLSKQKMFMTTRLVSSGKMGRGLDIKLLVVSSTAEANIFTGRESLHDYIVHDDIYNYYKYYKVQTIQIRLQTYS